MTNDLVARLKRLLADTPTPLAMREAIAEIERLCEDNAILTRLVGAEQKYRAEMEATIKHQASRIHSQRDEINRLTRPTVSTLRPDLPGDILG